MNTHPAFAPGSPLHGLARFAPEDWMRLFWHVRLESGVEAVARLCNLARETAAGLLAQSRLHRMVEAATPRTTSDPHDPADVDPVVEQ